MADNSEDEIKSLSEKELDINNEEGVIEEINGEKQNIEVQDEDEYDTEKRSNNELKEKQDVESQTSKKSLLEDSGIGHSITTSLDDHSKKSEVIPDDITKSKFIEEETSTAIDDSEIQHKPPSVKDSIEAVGDTQIKDEKLSEQGSAEVVDEKEQELDQNELSIKDDHHSEDKSVHDEGEEEDKYLETIIESALTDQSNIDFDTYDQETRMVNTQAQNTPSQEVVTVKFITKDGLIFTHAFNLSSTIKEVKEQMGELIRVDTKSIKLSRDGFDVDDWLPLGGLGVEAFGCIELLIESMDPTQTIIGVIDINIPSVDVITVHVLQDDGSFKDIIVEIHDEAYCKLWLGGYRNKKTKIEYHHACTQTLPQARKVFTKLDNPPGTYEYFLFHRDTQTPFKPKSIGIDTATSVGTQMYRSDCIIPSNNDKIITAKKFESYDEWLINNKIIEKVIRIQRFVKSWLKKKTYTNIIEIQKQLMKEVHDQKLQMLQEQVEKKRQMITGAAFPSKRDDFYMLYLMVGKWWNKEWQRIKDSRTDEPKKAEFCALLEKEITLLSAIEKHRIKVKNESLRKQEMRFLDVTSRPFIFRNVNGGMISIDNMATQKAMEFKELYSTLISENVSSKERIEFLLTLKNMMESYKEYEYSKDILTLIEREINLLVVGIKGDELKGVRKRIEQLFMFFLRQPQFNPKAASYHKPNWPKTVDILYRCTRCFKLLPVSGYPVHTRLEKISICKSCEWLQNIGHQRIDMSPYLRLLKQIQNSEMQQCCYSSICFVLQQKGCHFLVNTIWHGHSAISESRVLSNLRLVRWIKTIEWSPWNNILLTEEEANCHNSIDNVLEFYDKAFIDNVRQKHILARVHFISLLKTDCNLRITGEWENLTDSGPYLHPSHIDAFVKKNTKF